MASPRRTPLVTNEYYHIFNRGVARMPTFLSKRDYKQALLSILFYNNAHSKISLSRFKKFSTEEQIKFYTSRVESEKLVQVVAFCLMPNHFHFLLQQLQENGISKFLSQFTNSYTRYFNTTHNRVGPVYQGVFKSVHIETDEQLVHLSRYIHLNPIVSNVIHAEELETYQWSSFSEYLNRPNKKSANIVLQQFRDSQDYKDFVLDHVTYAKELHRIKHLLLE